MTPKDVKQKRKTISAAAASAGARRGQRHRSELRSGPAPSIGGRLRSSRVDPAQTPRRSATTTATLKKTWAARIGPEAALEPSEERQERGRDDDRRQHERHDHERAHERAAGEVEPADDPGERQADGERQDGRRGRLPDGEPGRESGERSHRRGESSAPSCQRPRARIAPTGPREEERRGTRPAARPRATAARSPRARARSTRRSTAPGHAPISAGERVSGSVGTVAA